MAAASETQSIVEMVAAKVERLRALEAEASELRRELEQAWRASGVGVMPEGAWFRGARQGSSVGLCIAILKKEQRPMHARELNERIVKDYGLHVGPLTVVSNLSRLVKKGRFFKRVGMNTFALREWDA